jgi:DNA-binding transcriptional ArsR family regulator
MDPGDVLGALSDPTRRAIVQRLALGPATATQLAELAPMSRPAVSQHLRVLREAGLVTEHRVGTRHIYQADPRGLAELRAYFDDFWVRALDAFKHEVES